MNYKISKSINPKRWNSNLKQSEYVTFFQTAEYLTPSKNKFPIFVEVFDSDKIVGQLGLLVTIENSGSSGTFLGKLSSLGSKLGNRASWVNGPILHSKDIQYRKKILQTIMSALNEIVSKFNILIIDGYSPPQDVLINEEYREVFLKNKFQIENFVTLQTDLNQSIEQLWNNLKKNARNDVTKAKRDGIIVKDIVTENELLNYKTLVQTWASTKGVNKHSKIDIKQDLLFLNSKTQKFLIAIENNHIIAGLRIGCFNNIAYTHQVINSYSKSGNVAGSLLSWSAIEWAKKSKMKIYDFSGGKAPPLNPKELPAYEKQWKSLFSYKRKWGGKEIPYYHFVKITSKSSYKFSRLLSKPDYLVRNYKKNHYRRYDGGKK